jgi:2-(1,2-epoxy-1,2-dihydrophenyl)acetyl-CoA isomerase
MSTIDTGTKDLLAEIDDGVAVITMNRPERRNAFSTDMVYAMGRVLADLEIDDSVGAVVVTGAGGAFCAGGDVKAMAERSALFSPDASFDDLINLQRINQRATSGRLWSRSRRRRSFVSTVVRPALRRRQRGADHGLRPGRLRR